MRRCAALTMLLVTAALGRSSDPRDLLDKAKRELAAPGQLPVEKMIHLLKRANDVWAQQSSEDPAYADSLDFEALLLRNKLADHSMRQWRTEAAPLGRRALQIRESRRDTSPDDLALALELAADTYESGREGGGAAFWRRATAIRADNIAATEPREAEAENLPMEKIGGQVTMPRLLSKVEATYSDVARLGWIQGTSEISFVVDTNGVPRHFGLRRGCGYGLDENAVQAARQWRFRPATKDGKAVNVIANIQVSFRLMRPATR